MSLNRLLVVFALVIPASSALAQTRTEDTNWVRIKLDERFRSEGVAAADFNNDGRVDVVAGDVWYEAPATDSDAYLAGKWKLHEVRKPGDFVAGKGYSQSFVNMARDFDNDGWTDVLVVGFPGAPFHWYRNPGTGSKDHWKEHVIWPSICNESPLFQDVDGDGTPELIFGSQPEAKMGIMQVPSKSEVTAKWTFTAISEKGEPKANGTFKYYHGLGIGDVNNDGRNDVMIPHGWWEAPKTASDSPWKWHSTPMLPNDGKAPVKAANMYAIDLDLDGDNDIIMSSAHAYGVWWFENVGGNEKPEFKQHLIDKSYSQTHAMAFVDMNGDGEKDMVTGKRFFAHNGNDPGGNDPVVMYWYEIKRTKGKPPEFLAHEIVAGRDTGVGTQFEVFDVNQDDKPDIVLSNKKGVNVLVQK